MPETRLERVLATIGLVAIAVLTALVVVGVLDYRQQASAGLGGQRASTAASSAADRSGLGRAAAMAPTLWRSSDLRATLVVAAERGDCWLEVHVGSVDGNVVYEGLLAKGDARAFTGKALWIRFGAAQNLDVTLDGRAVDNLLEGTAEVLVTSRGFKPAVS